MPVTIRDVARRAGVSPITVSRAFSGTHPVAEETRRRVLQAAEELGYVPNLVARGMVHKRVPMIGVVVPELANPFFVPIIDAVQAVARERNHMVVISQSQSDPDMERASINQFRQMRMAGALITPASMAPEHLRSLRDHDMPIVVVARCWDDGDCVTVDDVAGGRLVAEHLLRLGHRRIGCVAHGGPGNVAVQARMKGFRSALEAGGCSLPSEWVIRTQTVRLADAIQAAEAFLELSERPTAVFVTADRLAIGFIHRLRARGVRVPEDVAVVGYDDIRYAEFLEVPLTTVALPKYEMGKRAAEILFERVSEEGDGKPYRVLLEPKLIVRASCGAQPANRQGHPFAFESVSENPS